MEFLIGFIVAVFFAVLLIMAYFLPTLVAYYRKHQNAFAIFVLNLLLGWSFFGWAIALVWAVVATKTETQPVTTSDKQ